MNEKLLQYLWNFKIFTHYNFKDTDGNPLEIIDFGQWNFDSGPDFLYGKIKTNGILLTGNIELHVKSSDWIFHGHSGNPEFENIIAHVVFTHDTDITVLTEKNIPTLELKNYIDAQVLAKYESLLQESHFIACEKLIEPRNLPFYFHQETLLKKLDDKAAIIEEALKINKNNYEAVLFQHLAYGFGLKVNADIFQQIAERIDYSTINKIRQNQTNLEALLFGFAGWLDIPVDEQTKVWKREFDFLKSKYQLPDWRLPPKFSKLRPPNFPTIRLSQFASLYHKNQNLFSKFIHCKTVQEMQAVFEQVKASAYWDQRYNFGRISTVHGEKTLTKEFIDLLLINVLLPIIYTYHKNTDENIPDEILDMFHSLAPEKNKIIQQWKNLKIPVESALQSQSLLYHYRHYCQRKNCLKCGIGLQLLNLNH